MTYSEKVMKKCILLFVILNICAISTLHSQWLEKEGYWELSEKIPGLRDLKILPEENLIITVSNDNTIRHIEYDSGKILKSGKPTGLPDSNDYAKISSDGKTTVVARYVKNEKYSTQNMTINDMEITIINLKNFSLIAEHLLLADSVRSPYEYSLSYYHYYISFFDYFLIENRFFYAINYGLDFEGYPTTGGPPKYSINSGFQINGSLHSGKLITSNRYNSHYTNEYVPLDKNHENYILVGSNYYSKSNAHNGDVQRDNFVACKNRLFNNFNIIAKYSYTYNRNSDAFGDYGSTESGAVVPIYQLFGSENPNICYYRISGKLIELDIEAEKILKTFEHPLFKKVINMSNDSKLIHTIESKDYVIYSFPYYKEIFRVGIDTVFALPRAYLDETKGVILIPNSARRLVMFKPDAMTDVPQFGFDWSKDTVYTDEPLNFRALTNIEGSKFVWEFSNGELINSDSNEISHKFMETGKFGVTLKITKPDGSTLSFSKDSIITVMEIVKADFEVTELNNELPLKVQFTDISKGANTSWTWDFGDGGSSSEQNPVHEYNYPGDFSPRLIVSDGIDWDTIIKYEEITFQIGDVDENNSINELKMKTGISELRNAFFIGYGININWTYQYDTDRHFKGYRDYYSGVVSYTYDFELNNNKIDSVILTHWNIYYSDYFDTKSIKMTNQNTLIAIFSIPNLEIVTYNFSTKRKQTINELKYKYSVDILSSLDSSVYWIINIPNNANVIKTENDKILSELSIPPNAKQYLADTLDNGLNLITKNQDNSFSYFSISAENTLNYEKSFSIDTNITLTNIKSVNENLILLHGSYKDIVNKTTYAYLAKYHPLDNTLQDTILYSRKDIRKIERVNNSTYAAIGQSRGRQGYLLLDTNLHQIKDIRVDSLTGEIKDMLLHDNKVYLFTEKIVSLETMALGAKESYQTTASVLGLPEDIIASLEDTPIISTDKLTHSVYPNPTNEVLNLKVSTNESSNYTIKLYDIFGTEILNIQDGFIPAHTEKIFSIPTSSLSIGSYYYVISGGGSVERGKVLIIR